MTSRACIFPLEIDCLHCVGAMTIISASDNNALKYSFGNKHRASALPANFRAVINSLFDSIFCTHGQHVRQGDTFRSDAEICYRCRRMIKGSSYINRYD